MSKQLKGSLMVITAGIAWGVSGVSGQDLMAHGVNVNLLTSLRLILGGLGIGTNHFLSYLQYHHSVNAVGAFENYLLVLGWIVGWWLENASRKTV